MYPTTEMPNVLCSTEEFNTFQAIMADEGFDATPFPNFQKLSGDEEMKVLAATDSESRALLVGVDSTDDPTQMDAALRNRFFIADSESDLREYLKAVKAELDREMNAEEN